MNCDLCQHELVLFLDLGLQPMANKYPKKEDIENEKRYPLEIYFCNHCKNVQLGYKVSRNTMFEDYYYLSSVNQGLVRHFKSLAQELKNSEFVVDIGSNDGILLKCLEDLRVKCLGVEPSINVGKIANNKGLETIISFFNSNCVKEIINRYNKPDVIVCSSTFTHLENPHQLISDVKELLKDDGKFIVEVEYIGNFLKNVQFERFYLDRIFYYSLTSLDNLFAYHNMKVVEVEDIEPHGGSLKVTVCKNSCKFNPSERVKNKLKIEEKELSQENLLTFKEDVNKCIKEFKEKLQEFKEKGLKVCGYGSPARVSTICNFGGIDSSLIKFTVDDSPLKQNRFTPGTHIPILSKNDLEEFNPDFVVMFAYEYFQDIKKKLSKKYNYIMPIPFKIIE